MGGGEAEDLDDFFARIVAFRKSKKTCASRPISENNAERRWVPMDHSKSKIHEGVAVFLAIASNLSKKFRIEVFEHFTHQLVIMFIDELVAV